MEEQPDGSFPNQARIDYLQPNTEYQVILSKLYDSGDETRQTMNIRTLEEIDTVTVCKKNCFYLLEILILIYEIINDQEVL